MNTEEPSKASKKPNKEHNGWIWYAIILGFTSVVLLFLLGWLIFYKTTSAVYISLPTQIGIEQKSPADRTDTLTKKGQTLQAPEGTKLYLDTTKLSVATRIGMDVQRVEQINDKRFEMLAWGLALLFGAVGVVLVVNFQASRAAIRDAVYEEIREREEKYDKRYEDKYQELVAKVKQAVEKADAAVKEVEKATQKVTEEEEEFNQMADQTKEVVSQIKDIRDEMTRIRDEMVKDKGQGEEKG